MKIIMMSLLTFSALPTFANETPRLVWCQCEGLRSSVAMQLVRYVREENQERISSELVSEHYPPNMWAECNEAKARDLRCIE